MTINIFTFHLTVRQLDPLPIPEHPGSMLRGAFGHALRELSCITDLPDCKQCPVNQQCHYTAIFETQTIKSTPNSSQATNPYILRLPTGRIRHLKPSQTWTFGITLVGQSINHYALVLRAWQQAITFGFDSQGYRAKGELIKVSNQTQTVFIANNSQSVSQSHFTTPYWQIRRIPTISVIDNLSKITLHFLTPFRIQHQGKIAFHSHQLDPKVLLVALYNRVQQCNQQHDPNRTWEINFTDFQAFLVVIDKLIIESDLDSVKIQRKSSRQNRKIELFGLIGDIHLTADTDTLNCLMPLLWLGQYLHIGKNATLGLGQYQLQLRTTENTVSL